MTRMKEHGISAYTTGRCRCDEICRPLWAAVRRKARAEGRQTMSGAQSVTPLVQFGRNGGAVVTLRQYSHHRILTEWLKDGADPETLARRVGMSRKWVNIVLHAIQEAIGVESRTAMAIAFLRGDVVYRVASDTLDETSGNLARRRIGA